MTRPPPCLATLAKLLLVSPPLLAGVARAAESATQPATAKAPDAIDLYFDNGSAAVRAEDTKLLDRASRLYAEGKPIVMIVAGTSDRVGSPGPNLRLSEARATNVVHGLVERGIPVERFQILAKGISDLPVPSDPGKPEPQDRRVEITWR